MKPVELLTLVADTREQQPWMLRPHRVVRAALPAGDYSLQGMEARVAIERKSLADYVASCTWGRPRFERELERLAKYERAVIVVEASLLDILEWRYETNARPQALLATVASFSARYRVETLFAGSRAAAEFLAVALLEKWGKHLATKTEAA